MIHGILADGVWVVSGDAQAPAGLSPGYFLPPTLLDGVQQSMWVASEEVFGPVISVLGWDKYDDMIEQVSSVDYGLTASVWTDNLRGAPTTARAVDVGYVWVNDVSDAESKAINIIIIRPIAGRRR